MFPLWSGKDMVRGAVRLGTEKARCTGTGIEGVRAWARHGHAGGMGMGGSRRAGGLQAHVYCHSILRHVHPGQVTLYDLNVH